MQFSDLEILEAVRTLYSNIYSQAETLAALSADTVSGYALKAAIEGDSVKQWIADTALDIIHKQKLQKKKSI